MGHFTGADSAFDPIHETPMHDSDPSGRNVFFFLVIENVRCAVFIACDCKFINGLTNDTGFARGKQDYCTRKKQSCSSAH